MCAKLGIEAIPASSPQAKAREKRQHGTHQDRLVKMLRRKPITSHEAANVYLESEYLLEHNRRFARAASNVDNYDGRTPLAAELDQIFRLESERKICNDWAVRYRFGNCTWSRRARVRHRKSKWACAKGVTETSRSSIGGGRCNDRKFQYPRNRARRRPRLPWNGPANRNRRRDSGNGCPRATTRSERPLAEESKDGTRS